MNIVDKLKSIRSDIALSSDFIVGFPGETDKDFEQTMKFIENIKFVIAYSFMFSSSVKELLHQNLKRLIYLLKKARLSALQSLLKEQQKNYNKSFVKTKYRSIV